MLFYVIIIMLFTQHTALTLHHFRVGFFFTLDVQFVVAAIWCAVCPVVFMWLTWRAFHSPNHGGLFVSVRERAWSAKCQMRCDAFHWNSAVECSWWLRRDRVECCGQEGNCDEESLVHVHWKPVANILQIECVCILVRLHYNYTIISVVIAF